MARAAGIPIVLLTDFGLQDPFVGIMKGVILKISPQTPILDLTHGIRPQDVFQGAFALFRSAGYFPRGTIFCAVVDPGVGTARKALAIQTRDYTLVGPDNGLLWPAAEQYGLKQCVSIENPEVCLDRISQTFHGRDVFAPAAAHLAQGLALDRLGPKVPELVRLTLPRPEPVEGGLVLTVMDIDGYGNLTLNLRPQAFEAEGKFELRFKSQTINRCYPAYGLAPETRPFLVQGSSGFMEVAVKNGSAAGLLQARVMDRVVLRWGPGA